MGGSLMNNSKDNEQIDIKRMIEVVLDRIVSILVITIVFGLAAYALSEFFFVKKYESSVTMVVNNEVSQENQGLDPSKPVETKTYSSDITASQLLVPTCIEIIKSDAILEQVATEIKTKTKEKFSVWEINKMLTVEEIPNTYIVRIEVLNNDRVMAREIADSIGRVTETKMQNYIPRSSIKVVDWAKLSSTPASPNVRNNTILGALLGFVLSISFILLKEIFDVRVKSADDLVARFELPVLGAIPEIYVSYDDSSNDEESED